MIRIIKGIYGHVDGDRIIPKTSKDPPFSLSSEKEAKLVQKGVAEYVNDSITEDPKPAPKKKAKRGG